MRRRKSVRAADLFCGAGGTSEGMLQACKSLGLDLNLVAVNHWPLAIETHLANHPWARHLCASLTSIDLGPDALFSSIDAIDPRKVVDGKLDLLVASPECTHHSNARGGAPVNDQSRASAWCVLRWADALLPESILIENVPEFQSWGPIGRNGKPLKSRKGETYQAFLTALESLGYRVEPRVLNSANYGDATTRRRLFVMARRGGKGIEWPDFSHHKEPELGQDSWRTAAEVVEWDLPSRSIFEPGRKLSPKTMARITTGLERYCGTLAEPFKALIEGRGGEFVIDRADMPESFLTMFYGTGTARSLDRPLPTVTAGGGHIGLAEPFILPHRQFQNMNADSIRKPMRTITGVSRDMQLVQPFLVPHWNERPTQAPRTHAIDEPMPTVTSRGCGQVVSPFLVSYYGNSSSNDVQRPLPTVTTKDRFGLVEPIVIDEHGERFKLDVHLRMLQPSELARAMSFPDEYRFGGSRTDQVKQIGNAVPIRTAAALCRSHLAA